MYVDVSLLDTTPTSSYHNTSRQWAAATAGINVEAEDRELSAAAAMSLNDPLVLLVLSSVTAGKVSSLRKL